MSSSQLVFSISKGHRGLNYGTFCHLWETLFKESGRAGRISVLLVFVIERGRSRRLEEKKETREKRIRGAKEKGSSLGPC